MADAPRVLVIDVGRSHVKFLATGESEPRDFDSGKKMTADEMTGSVLARTQDWSYDVIALGVPCPVLDRQ